MQSPGNVLPLVQRLRPDLRLRKAVLTRAAPSSRAPPPYANATVGRRHPKAPTAGDKTTAIHLDRRIPPIRRRAATRQTCHLPCRGCKTATIHCSARCNRRTEAHSRVTRPLRGTVLATTRRRARLRVHRTTPVMPGRVTNLRPRRTVRVTRDRVTDRVRIKRTARTTRHQVTDRVRVKGIARTTRERIKRIRTVAKPIPRVHRVIDSQRILPQAILLILRPTQCRGMLPTARLRPPPATLTILRRTRDRTMSLRTVRASEAMLFGRLRANEAMPSGRLQTTQAMLSARLQGSEAMLSGRLRATG